MFLNKNDYVNLDEYIKHKQLPKFRTKLVAAVEIRNYIFAIKFASIFIELWSNHMLEFLKKGK